MGMESALYRGRRRIEQRMTDECVIRRRSGNVTSPTGVITPAYTQIYSGKCRIQSPTEQGAEKTIGQAVVIVTKVQLQLPITDLILKDGDEVIMTAALYDPALVGRKYVIRDVPAKSEATARRVGVIEVTS